MTQNKSTKSILLNYFSYLSLFIGSAFVSGAIVHTGNVAEVSKYAIIGIVGVSLFILGSFIQESIFNQNNLKEEGVAKFFLYSLLLSVGVGMMSGGTQHFSDFPVYSSYLVPLGLIVSYLAFLLKNNFTFTKNLIIAGVALLLISIFGFVGLNTYAKSLTESNAKQKASECAKTSFDWLQIKVSANAGHDENICPPKDISKSTEMNKCPTGQSKESMPEMCMPNMNMNNATVKDDKSFIEYVIPHHQDAIDSSQKVLKTTQDPELKAFLNNVITAQGSEITLLKGYYKTWYGKDYIVTNSPSMMKLDDLAGVALDKEYVSGMLGHHSGIIDIAKIVLSDSKTSYKPEILTLSKQIIKDQEADNVVLTKWINTKYTSSNSNPMDADGHMGH